MDSQRCDGHGFLAQQKLSPEKILNTAIFLYLIAILLAYASNAHSEVSDDTYTDYVQVPSSDPLPANSLQILPSLPVTTPRFFPSVYNSALRTPLPRRIYAQGGIPAEVPQLELDRNFFGVLGTYQPAGATTTTTNAFFQSLGQNGRSCVTCHQPPSGMSVSVTNIAARLRSSGGTDPIFAPVDGSNCPNLVAATDTSGALYGGRLGQGQLSFRAAHSLLLNKGLFRIFLPLPANAEFTVQVVNDPTTCNLDPNYNSSSTTAGATQIISVFRRPVISANLVFKTTTLFPAPNGHSGNIMWDGREPTLESQAIDATLGHAQALTPPTDAQVAQIVQFETGVFSAQSFDNFALWLNGGGAHGGPVHLASAVPGQLNALAFDEYSAWTDNGIAFARRSIARGQQIFNTRTFTIGNVAGFNDAVGNNAFPGTCSTCHNMQNAGADAIPAAQRDIGIGGQSVTFGGPSPSADLPVFRVTCKPEFSPLFNPRSVLTNDPGRALISGKCADIGARTVPSLRALAAHVPYFSDGSAATLFQLVGVYDKRFHIGLSFSEKMDLVNFLNAL